MIEIKIRPLTQESFTLYGDVIQCEGSSYFHINNAHTERYHALAETEAHDAVTGISIFRNLKITPVPFEICMLERHPLGSQAFLPMHGQQFLIIVAPNLNADQPDLQRIQAFISNGFQGVNYRAGTWHHPLLSLEAPSDFAVIDRVGKGHNCDVFQFNENCLILR